MGIAFAFSSPLLVPVVVAPILVKISVNASLHVLRRMERPWEASEPTVVILCPGPVTPS